VTLIRAPHQGAANKVSLHSIILEPLVNPATSAPQAAAQRFPQISKISLTYSMYYLFFENLGVVPGVTRLLRSLLEVMRSILANRTKWRIATQLGKNASATYYLLFKRICA